MSFFIYIFRLSPSNLTLHTINKVLPNDVLRNKLFILA